MSTKSRETLRKDFNTCTEIGTDNDMKTFISNLAGVFQGTAQYNRITEGVNEIGVICKNMTKTSDSYQNLVDLYKVGYFGSHNGQYLRKQNNFSPPSFQE